MADVLNARTHTRLVAVVLVFLLLVTALPLYLPHSLPGAMGAEEDMTVESTSVPQGLQDGVWNTSNAKGHYVSKTDGLWEYDPYDVGDEWEQLVNASGLEAIVDTPDGLACVGEDAGGEPMFFRHEGTYAMGSSVVEGDGDVSTDLYNIYEGFYPAMVTSYGSGDPATGEWDPWTSWTSTAAYQSEYVYERNIAGAQVSTGDRRVTPVPIIDFYNYIDVAGPTTINDLKPSSVLEMNPVEEGVTLTYNGGSMDWNVEGDASGVQAGTLQDCISFLFSSGVNSGRVDLYLDYDSANYVDGNTITFEIDRTGWYEPYSTVAAADTDTLAPYYPLSNSNVTNCGIGDPSDWDDAVREDVYIDLDNSFTVSAGDVRVTAAAAWNNMTPSTGSGLHGACYNEDSGEVTMAGDDFTALSYAAPEAATEDATTFLDQYQTLTTMTWPIGEATTWGQTFVPLGEKLHGIEVYITSAVADSDITLHLYDGEPDSGSLQGQAVLVRGDFSAGWNSFEFETPVAVNPWYMYFLYLTSSGTYNVLGSDTGAYDEGSAWHRDGTWNDQSGLDYDLAFKTFRGEEFLDQYNHGGSEYLQIYTDGIAYTAGQGFYTTIGTIGKIDVYLEMIGSPSADIVMTVRYWNDGGAIEGSTTLNKNDIQDGWNSFVFSGGLSLSSGWPDTYFFSLSTTATYANRYIVKMSSDNPYHPGMGGTNDAYYNDGVWATWAGCDLAFRTYDMVENVDQSQPSSGNVIGAVDSSNEVGQTFV
ncbi:MAG: hypothetical protein KAT70_05350, partial [Thermoplasmata archaeon]|nr:hypothetical protein [Thermoplasmata archaeon]